MTRPNPQHLFDQADRLAANTQAGAPRQVDLRRAISAAYYGIFHFTVAAATDELMGIASRSTLRYALAYRSVAHKTLNDVCVEAKKQTMARRYAAYAPGGFGADLRAFAAGVVELQQRRHSADYDPAVRFKASDARVAVSLARSATARFQAASLEEQRTFLALLMFDPRS